MSSLDAEPTFDPADDWQLTKTLHSYQASKFQTELVCAELEQRTLACAILQRFRVRLREGWDVMQYDAGYKDYFSATRPELPVVLERRW